MIPVISTFSYCILRSYREVNVAFAIGKGIDKMSIFEILA